MYDDASLVFFRKWPSSLQVLNWDWSTFLPFCTCIPPDPPAAASACPVALPCFVSVFQSLISRAKPSLPYKNWISNLRGAQKCQWTNDKQYLNRFLQHTKSECLSWYAYPRIVGLCWAFRWRYVTVNDQLKQKETRKESFATKKAHL